MESLINKLKGYNNIMIYGTEDILNTTCIFLNKFGIECQKVIEGQDSITSDNAIDKLIFKAKDSEILLISTKMEYQKDIVSKLEKFKLNNVIFITGKIYNSLKLLYVKRCYEENGKDFFMLKDLSESNNLEDISEQVKIFMVKSYKDKFLENKVKIPSWVIPIQAGRDCTDIEVSQIVDNKGDNISKKNPMYCELTAMYWIWKNTNYKYTGLCHYRRHFVIDKKDVNYLENSDIDVVLPTPSVCNGSVKDYYYRNHVVSHWENMMNLLKEKYFEYYKTAEEVFNKEYYYACNMLIARRKVFDEYCSWLFEILFELEKICEPQSDSYNGRYIGFLAERLTSLYFMHNKEKLKIVHAEKNFI